MRITLFFLLCVGLVLQSCDATVETSTTTDTTSSLNLDLDNPQDNLTAFAKVRASLDSTEEVVYYWEGKMYDYRPGERSSPLFGMEAYNIAKLVPVEGGYEMRTREVALYTDPKTGEILESWYNPFIEDTVNVIHVWNDPVNQKFMLEGRFGSWGVPVTPLGDDRLAFNADVMLLYPSPLPKAEYPEASRSDLYQAGELFQFFFNESDVNNPDLESVHGEVSWTRISDFLPWMKMGDRPGHMVYHCRGYKLMDGAFEALPKKVQDYVMSKYPEYAHAPDTYTSPNMTSWKYYKQVQGK